MKVALLQIAAAGIDIERNLERGERACREAAALGADVALFPEMWSIGYTYGGARPAGDLLRDPARWQPGESDNRGAWEEDAAAWKALAIPREGSAVQRFRSLAKELGMAIAITYLRDDAGAVRNSVTLFDAAGGEVLTYDKVHTCAFDIPEALLAPGEAFRVGKLATSEADIMVGAMICFDREFPESARTLMTLGAELILTPNACPLDVNRLSQFRVRAFENCVAVAMTNYPAPAQNGHSVAYDPIAYANDAPRDTLVVEAGEGEGIYLANFDFAAIREFRERDGWSSPYRRPDRYLPLVDPSLSPLPRVDARGHKFGDQKTKS